MNDETFVVYRLKIKLTVEYWYFNRNKRKPRVIALSKDQYEQGNTRSWSHSILSFVIRYSSEAIGTIKQQKVLLIRLSTRRQRCFFPDNDKLEKKEKIGRATVLECLDPYFKIPFKKLTWFKEVGPLKGGTIRLICLRKLLIYLYWQRYEGTSLMRHSKPFRWESFFV